MIRVDSIWLALGASDLRGGIDKLLAQVEHGFALGAQVEVMGRVVDVLAIGQPQHAGGQRRMAGRGEVAADALGQGGQARADGRCCCLATVRGERRPWFGWRCERCSMDGGEGAQAGGDAYAGAGDCGFEGRTIERQPAGRAQRAAQAGADKAAALFGQFGKVCADEMARRMPTAGEQLGCIHASITHGRAFGHGIHPMRRGNEGCATGRYQAALQRTACLHQFRGDDDIHLTWHRAQRHDRKPASRRRRLREHFKVMHSCAGTLCYTGHGPAALSL